MSFLSIGYVQRLKGCLVRILLGRVRSTTLAILYTLLVELSSSSVVPLALEAATDLVVRGQWFGVIDLGVE